MDNTPSTVRYGEVNTGTCKSISSCDDDRLDYEANLVLSASCLMKGMVDSKHNTI